MGNDPNSINERYVDFLTATSKVVKNGILIIKNKSNGDEALPFTKADLEFTAQQLAARKSFIEDNLNEKISELDSATAELNTFLPQLKAEVI